MVARPGRVLFISAGFTGSEVASVCRELGLEVTVAEAGAAPRAPRSAGDRRGGRGAVHARSRPPHRVADGQDADVSMIPPAVVSEVLTLSRTGVATLG